MKMTVMAGAVAALLAACAVPVGHGLAPAASAASAPAAAASAPAAAASANVPGAMAARPAPEPGAPRPFAEVTKGASVEEGLFPIWRKDEKVWIEIPKDMLGKPFMFSANIASSVGERGLYASQMTGGDVVEFRRIGNQIQLMALNMMFRAVADQGGKRAIDQGFSPSLLGATPMAAAEQPERKSLLVDASFLLSDIPGYSTLLEYVYRLPFAPDRSNSYFEATRADSELSTFTARIHFATARIPAPPLIRPPVPIPTPPQATPDPRSFFVSYVYNFQKLPEKPLEPRPADPRLGYFTSSFVDLGGDLKANPMVHYINRWRLEKKDPEAAMSEPVKPITYWMDKNIPPKYRPAVEAGILEWNKAFEKIGFKNAVVARQQPDDANWDDMDAEHASVRWFVGADVGFAIGPHLSDPRSGEILDADIGMSDVFARGAREFLSNDAPQPPRQAMPALFGRSGAAEDGADYCSYAHDAAAEMNFALELLEARGEIAPDSPEAEAFVAARIKDVVMHEIGHTLGLKHNFKASTTVTQAQLDDKAWTEAHGISGSVMDYNAYNIAVEGEPQGSFNNTTLGPYDYWAIEYGYKTLAKESEAAELEKIASRSTEPELAYADDVEAGFGSGSAYDGMDPLANRFDLGPDPMSYFKRRLQLSRELWKRIEDRKPQAGEDPLRQRRALVYGFSQLYRSVEVVGKYVGGVYAERDLPYSTGRPSFRPVEPARQREALKVLSTGLFSTGSFHFRPEFLANLTVDYNVSNRGGPISVAAGVAALQEEALDRLLSPQTAARLLDLPAFVAPAQRKGLISLGEVYGTVQNAIWAELKTGAEIDRLRRNLQRDYLKRLQFVLVKSPANLPPDALSLARLQATRLQAELRAAASKGSLSIETRAHLAESLALLNEALRATMLKS